MAVNSAPLFRLGGDTLALEDRLRNAAAMVLGGTRPQEFWGFRTSDFTQMLRRELPRLVADPEEAGAQWAHDIPWLADDMVDYEVACANLDLCRCPAHYMDLEFAREFARGCTVYGINGPIGSGKDVLASTLSVHAGFRTISFADPVRLLISTIYNVPLRHFVDRELKHAPLPHSSLTPRRLMQLVGTEVCRSFSEDIWVNRALLRVGGGFMNPATRMGYSVVVPDCRFDNEVEAIRGAGGRLIRLSRPGTEDNASLLGSCHSSEAGIRPAESDIEMTNSGELRDFQAAALRLLDCRVPPSLERRGAQAHVR